MKVEAGVFSTDFGNLRLMLISRDAAKVLDICPGCRVKVIVGRREFTFFAGISNELSGNKVLLPRPIYEVLGRPSDVELVPYVTPTSVRYIKKKLHGSKLSYDEIYTIIKDVVSDVLTDVEIAAFISAQMSVGMDVSEMISLTKAMVETGNKLEFDKPVYDMHSIGGVPGNSKVSIVAVPIIASTGVFIPKTSSRAITSPAGTADTMEVFANVEFTTDEVLELSKKVNGFIIWGGTLNLAPADDILIRVEYVLMADPLSQMIASILSKKLSMSVKNLLIDIPVGAGAKVESLEKGRELASIFTQVGHGLELNIRCALTYGEQPIGYTVGPALEAKEALETLLGGGPMSLREKATSLAGVVLEMAGAAPKGAGRELAKEVLSSGKAYEMFKNIISAQGGNPEVRPNDTPIGKHKAEVRAPIEGYVTGVYNKPITTLARIAGAPYDKGAGVKLYVKRGHKVRKGEVLMEIYSNSSVRLEEAIKKVSELKPIAIEGMLLEMYPEYM
ncbi:MAG: AMP phosphorylase [Desulfurococcales archaeon]|nr:AMP phosphorylase [Desulfurococcales archaeon]